MKRCLLALLLLVSIKGISQIGWTDHIGATWYYGYNGWVEGGVIERKYTNDTIINTHTYRVLTVSYYKATYVFPNDIPTPVLDTIISWGKLFLKVSGDSVFQYYPQADTSYLLYNFNAQPGDEWNVYHQGYGVCPYARVKVDSVGVEIINGVSCRWINLSPVDSSGWIIGGRINERFGPRYYFWQPTPIISCDTSIVIDTNIIVDDDVYWFNCFVDNLLDYHVNPNPNVYCNQLTNLTEIIPASQKFSIFPNPSQGITNINPVNTAYSYNLTVYDMAGRQLHAVSGLKGNYQLETQPLPKGLYTIRIEQAGKLYYHKLLVQ